MSESNIEFQRPLKGLGEADLAWLHRLASALVADDGAAEDLVQDAALAALKAPSFPRVESPRAWMRSVVHRLWARRQRSAIRFADRTSEATAPEPHPSPEELVATAEAAERALASARALPVELREPVLLHYIEGLDTTEVAARTGLKPDTVRWRIRRGVERMRADLDRTDGESRAPWALLLLPLAKAGPASKTVVPTSAFAMKAVAVSVVVIVLALSVGFLIGPAGLRGPDGSATDLGLLDVGLLDVDSPIRVNESRMEPLAEVGAAASAERTTEDPSKVSAPRVDDRQGLHGITVGADGRPVSGATVYLAASAARDGGEGKAKGSDLTVRSDDAGRFFFADAEVRRWYVRHADASEIGAVANGFLRTAEPLDVLSTTFESPLRLVLSGGSVLSGRVEDEAGRPVEGLLLLAHRPFRGSDHVSPSRVSLRGNARNLAPAGSTYHQCEATSQAGGAVSFSGLDVGEYTVRSLDPAWTVQSWESGVAGGPSVVWTVERRYGVRLTGTLGGSNRPIDFGATFLVALTYGDGRVENTGQWVGSGRGSVSFRLQRSMMAAEYWDDLVAVRFYGEAKRGDEVVKWTGTEVRTEELERGRFSTAEVVFEQETEPAVATQAPEVRPDPVRMVQAQLDVRYRASGAPFDGRLVVAWRSGDQFDRSAVATSLGAGRYALEVPEGRVTMDVQDSRASGSMDPVRVTLDTETDGGRTLFIELEEGGTARILRPVGWAGEWFVKASYRTDAEGDWFGAWGYGTDGDELTLGAMRPAEWRFQLRRNQDSGEVGEVRIANVPSGQVTVVD